MPLRRRTPTPYTRAPASQGLFLRRRQVLHRQFPSGHSGASGAAATVLAAFFGESTTFTAASDGVPAPGNTRTFNGFAPALEEVALARVYGGIQFLGSCIVAQDMGRMLAEQAIATQMLPSHGDAGQDDGD
jgi:hypothetical protein